MVKVLGSILYQIFFFFFQTLIRVPNVAKGSSHSLYNAGNLAVALRAPGGEAWKVRTVREACELGQCGKLESLEPLGSAGGLSRAGGLGRFISVMSV